MSQIIDWPDVDKDAVEGLLDAAFGTDRKARAAYAVRAGAEPVAQLSFGLIDGRGMLIGSLQSWPVALVTRDGTHCPLVMVGPVAIAPEHQCEGHGRRLMDRLIDQAARHADGALMMIGDPEYYGRFWDFSADRTEGWTIGGAVDPRRLLARPINGHGVPGGPGQLGPRVGARTA